MFLARTSEQVDVSMIYVSIYLQVDVSIIFYVRNKNHLKRVSEASRFLFLFLFVVANGVLRLD